jgi:ribosomal protein L9
MKKIIAIIISFIFLGACAQTTALLGPAISVGSSGNVMQASFSYGTNLAVKKATGKMTSEHVSLYIEKKKKEKKLEKRDAKIRKEMVNYLQSHIEIMRDKLNSNNKL